MNFKVSSMGTSCRVLLQPVVLSHLMAWEGKDNCLLPFVVCSLRERGYFALFFLNFFCILKTGLQ